jgi:hypothetical protein
LVSPQEARSLISNNMTEAQSLGTNVSATNINNKSYNDTDNVVIGVAKTNDDFVSIGEFKKF